MTDQELNEKVARALGWRFTVPTKDLDSYEPGPKVNGYWSIGKEVIEDPKYPQDTYYLTRRTRNLPDYCTDIKAAWEIVDYIAPGCFGISIAHGTNPDFWQCEIQSKGWQRAIERADTATMAICLAFLKMKEAKE